MTDNFYDLPGVFNEFSMESYCEMQDELPYILLNYISVCRLYLSVQTSSRAEEV